MGTINWGNVKEVAQSTDNRSKLPEGSVIVPVAGVSFIPGYPDNLYSLSEELLQNPDLQIVAELRRNPENPYDSNAIEVWANSSSMVGHLPRETAAKIAPLLDSGVNYQAIIHWVRISSDNSHNPGLDVLVWSEQTPVGS